ncbi:MAG: triosephosphate isomerase [Planctomycetota bacterium]|nr:MAG: triosephosphate isomerase [Planctomycetota bacterium]
MRKPYIAANWKMNLDADAIDEFCAELSEFLLDFDAVRVGVFPPSLYLPQVVRALAGTGAVVGAQSCRPEASGAFTGEIAARMVADVGAKATLIGHSERRQIFGETDADVVARRDAALAEGLDVILCVGETLEEREAGRTNEVVIGQLEAALADLTPDVVRERVTLAYEPVWAIGTGKTATPDQAQEVHASIRARLAEGLGGEVASATIIQYGGSVKPDNVSELMACPDVDGALVGGASLQLESFVALLRGGQPGA